MKKNSPPFTLSDDNTIAIDNRAGEGKGCNYRSMSTGGQYGCIGCHFYECEDETPCNFLPCNEDEWSDGESRIWEKVEIGD